MAKTDSQLIAEANIIKNETTAGANTATRVGTMLDDIIANKINNDKIVTTLGGGSNENVPSEKAVTDAVAAKQNALGYTAENAANKENTTIDTSTTKYPTVNLLKTGLDSKQDTLVSGTNIKTINGSSVLGSGDLTIGLSYKIYTALLSYDGSTTTATQLQNTIGDGSGDGVNDIQWAFAGGFFVGTMTSGNPFTNNKTGVLPSTYWNLSNALYNLVGVRNSSTVIRYYSVKTSDGSLSTSNITNALIEIRVYP